MINKANIDRLTEKVKSGSGYVVFTATLTDKLDKRGARVIEFDYLRDHFTLDDTKNALGRFADHFKKDVMGGCSAGGIEEGE